MRLNLGANDRRVDGFISVDIDEPADQIVDLDRIWPWRNNTVEEVLAFDVFEHLKDKRHTMNELWRVLKDGGTATIECPNASKGAGAFQDCTHVSFWTRNDFEYYEKGNFARERFRTSEYYGVLADFEILSMTESRYDLNRPDGSKWDEVWKFKVVLKACKQ